jgi:hypothetical protein
MASRVVNQVVLRLAVVGGLLAFGCGEVETIHGAGVTGGGGPATSESTSGSGNSGSGHGGGPGAGGETPGGCPSCSAEVEWAVRLGGSGNEFVEDLAIDAAGNIVLTGRFEGESDLGAGVVTSEGLSDVFVVKLDPAGALLWHRTFGDADYQGGTRVAIDAASNVVLTANLTGTVDFGGGPLSGYGGSVVVALSPDGNHLWSRSLAVEASFSSTSIAFGLSGGMALAGSFGHDIDLGAGPVPAMTNLDLFLAVGDAGGSPSWLVQVPSGGFGPQPRIAEIGIGPSGEVWIAGTLTETVDFGGGPLVGAGAADAFIARFDADGNHLSSQRHAAADDQGVYALAVDDLGAVTAGRLAGTFDLGGGPLTGNDFDVFVASLTPSGSHSWSAVLPADIGIAHDISLTAAGDVVLVGAYVGWIDLAGTAFVSPDWTWQSWVVKLSRDGGEHLWSAGYGGVADSHNGATALGVSPLSGKAIVAGGFHHTIDFGTGALVSAGSSDVYVVALAP